MPSERDALDARRDRVGVHERLGREIDHRDRVGLRRSGLAGELQIQAPRVDEHRVHGRIAVARAERREVDGVDLRPGHEVEPPQITRAAPRDVRGVGIDHGNVARLVGGAEREALTGVQLSGSMIVSTPDVRLRW